jgi:hypothetical protein
MNWFCFLFGKLCYGLKDKMVKASAVGGTHNSGVCIVGSFKVPFNNANSGEGGDCMRAVCWLLVIALLLWLPHEHQQRQLAGYGRIGGNTNNGEVEFLTAAQQTGKILRLRK